MARRKRGMFDPDYRTKGWNRSRYAPKNSSMSISQLSGSIAFMLTGPLFYLLLLHPRMEILAIAMATLIFLWIFTARFIRKREWARIQRELAAEETAKQRDANATRQRQANKDLDLNNLTPRDFEHEVAWLLNTLSNFKAVVVGGSGDDGVDVELYQSGNLVGVVQCKYYDAKRTLQPAHVRELAGTKKAAGTRLGYLFTTARVTKRTRKIGDDLGVKVFDGEQVSRMRQKARAKAQR